MPQGKGYGAGRGIKSEGRKTTGKPVANTAAIAKLGKKLVNLKQRATSRTTGLTGK